jgi:heat shock protein HtpX
MFLFARRLLGLMVVFVPVGLFHAAGLIGLLAVTTAISLWLAHETLRRPPRVLRVTKPKLKADWRVRRAVRTISQRARMPEPDSGVLPDIGGDSWQAVALRLPSPGTVIVSRPLTRALDDRELTAVIGHELAHIWHPLRNEARILLVWGLLAGALMEIGYAISMFGPHFDSTRWYWPLATLALFVFGRPVAALVPLAVSRRPETEADEWACRLGCDGLCLASALWEIEADRTEQMASKSAIARARLQRIRAILKPKRRSWTAARRREALIKLGRSDLAAEHLLERLFHDHPALLERTRHLLEQRPENGSGRARESGSGQASESNSS